MADRISEILVQFLSEALENTVSSGLLPKFGDVAVEVEKTRHKDHGDYASGVAFQLARAVGKSPMEISEILANNTALPAYLDEIKAEKPGFINFFVSSDWFRHNVVSIEELGSRYGEDTQGKGRRVQVEFVSTNPNGPLHVGHARGAVIGSTLANLLAKGGYDVQREYYVNDGGSQMRSFARTLYAQTMELLGKSVDYESDAYAGEFMDGLAKQASEELGGTLMKVSQEEGLELAEEYGLKTVLGNIKETLENFGVRFDRWFSEKELLTNGTFKKVIDQLDKDGYINQSDGAVWFRTTKCGADQDDVLVRSGDAGHTYFATDIAYHYNKLAERKFDLVINVWGSDHHSHIARLKSALKVLGCDEEKLVILLTQLVHIQEGGESVKLSKRDGHMVAADELLDSINKDASRYVFLDRGASSQMTFDLELARKQSSENPVYYVQYAHARLSSILKVAAEKGINYADGSGNLRLLEHPRELDLMRCLAEFPEMVSRAVRNLEPHHLPQYAYELARELQRFYEECRVLSSDESELNLSKARLRLVASSKTVLAEALNLMGMGAPESM